MRQYFVVINKMQQHKLNMDGRIVTKGKQFASTFNPRVINMLIHNIH